MNSTSKRLTLAFLRALRSTVIIVAVAAIVVAFHRHSGGVAELKILAAQNWGILVVIFFFVAIWDYLMRRPKPPPGPPPL